MNNNRNQGTNPMKLRPLQDRIILRRLEADSKTPGGLYIPENAKEKPQRGEVIAVGEGKILDNGTRVPVECAPGDTVIFGKYNGTEVTLDDEKFLIIRSDDVLGVIEVQP